jgi:hypothetical protein
VSLSQIEKLLQRDEDDDSSPVHIQDRIGPCLGVALAGCPLALSAIEEELGNIGVEIESTTLPSRHARRSYTWDDSRMKEILEALRGQKSAATLFFYTSDITFPYQNGLALSNFFQRLY